MNRRTTGQSGENCINRLSVHAARSWDHLTKMRLWTAETNGKTYRVAHCKKFESSCPTPHSHYFKSDVNGPCRPFSGDGGGVKAIPRVSSNSYIIRIGPASCRIVSLRLSVCWCQGGLTEGTNMQFGSLEKSHPIFLSG